jgi:hypothetical protein
MENTVGGVVTTLLQETALVVNDLQDPETLGATALPQYISLAQAKLLFAQPKLTITGLTGGTATDP